jgi:hypothetical protein
MDTSRRCASPGSSHAASWKELSSKEKLLYVYIPLALTILAALAAVAISKGCSSLESHGAELEVVDVVLGNKPGYGEKAKAHVEVKLHNTGDRRAILTRLHTKVIRSAFLPSCLVLGGDGTYLTGRYSILLPAFPPDGYQRENVLNQELGPDRVDRFRATFEPKDIEVFTDVLYELDLTVEASDGSSVQLGRFLLMTPSALFRPSWPFVIASPQEQRQLEQQASRPIFPKQLGKLSTPGCYRRNLRLIAGFASSDAERSSSVDELLRHAMALSS